jgi:FeS assembly protein IscX
MSELTETGDNYPIYWEPTYEIVLALMAAHPDVDVNGVGMQQLFDWIVALPNFADNPTIVSDELLRDILREWYEESEENTHDQWGNEPARTA